jgi:hypothetical protein
MKIRIPFFPTICLSHRQCIIIWCIFILLLSYLLRLRGFTGNGVWQDEVIVFDQVFSGNYETNPDAPLFPAIIRLFVNWTHWQTIDAFRFVSIMIGGLLPLFAMVFAYQLRGIRCAIFASLLFAFSEYMMVFSWQIRPYGLFMILTLCIYTVFLRHLATGKHLLLLGALAFLCAMTHLLTAQIIIGLALASLLCHYFCKRENAQNYALTANQLYLLISVLCFSSLIGIWWVPARYENFIGDAIHGTSAIMPFLIEWAYALPFGIQTSGNFEYYFFYPIFLLGVFILYRNYRSAFILLCTMIVTVFLMHYFTYGNRYDWGYVGTRYFSHIIVFTMTLIAVGLDEIIRLVNDRLNIKSLSWVIILSILAVIVIPAYFHPEHRIKYSNNHLYWLRIPTGLGSNGAIFYIEDQRQKKIINMLSDELFDDVPVVFLENNQNNGYYAHRKKNLDRLEPGKYVTNFECKELVMLNDVNPNKLIFTEEREINTKLRLCTLDN